MASRDLIEAFALLSYAPSQVDSMYRVRPGTTRSEVVGWWADCKSGKATTDAVVRWRKDVSMFVSSNMEEDDMPLRGLPPSRVARLLEGAVKMLPAEEQHGISVVESGMNVYLRRR